MLTGLIIILAALLLDRLLGEPRRWHPLVAFGRFASDIESRVNHHEADPSTRYRQGAIAWLLSAGMITLLFSVLDQLLSATSTVLHWLASIMVLYLAIGWQSLKEHMLAIHRPLGQNDLVSARAACAMVVSRDTADLSGEDVSKAAVESTLENGSDGIFAAVFWFAILGIPGVILYRLSNTLDAMWGYRTERYQYFGWWSAKVDDALNWIPARITAFLYMLNPILWPQRHYYDNKPNTDSPISSSAISQRAWHHWQTQAAMLDSPNGGPVMVTGASVLNLRLGGPTPYHGTLKDKPFFGGDNTPSPKDIPRTLRLVDQTLVGWVIISSLLMGLQ